MVKDSKSLSTENGKVREVGEKRERGRCIDSETGREERQGSEFDGKPVDIMFIWTAVDAAGNDIRLLVTNAFQSQDMKSDNMLKMK